MTKRSRCQGTPYKLQCNFSLPATSSRARDSDISRGTKFLCVLYVSRLWTTWQNSGQVTRLRSSMLNPQLRHSVLWSETSSKIKYKLPFFTSTESSGKVGLSWHRKDPWDISKGHQKKTIPVVREELLIYGAFLKLFIQQNAGLLCPSDTKGLCSPNSDLLSISISNQQISRFQKSYCRCVNVGALLESKWKLVGVYDLVNLEKFCRNFLQRTAHKPLAKFTFALRLRCRTWSKPVSVYYRAIPLFGICKRERNT